MALEGAEEPLYRHCHPHRAFPQPGDKQGCPACSGLSRQEKGTVERVVGSGGREVSNGEDRGFKCCLDAKVIFLSEEPCGIISSSPELTLAMLKLAAQAGEFTWGKHSVPGWGRP